MVSAIPVRSHGRVIGAFEAYSDLNALTPRVDEARRMVWLSVGVGFLILYASLFAIVYGASRRLLRQMQEINLLAGLGFTVHALIRPEIRHTQRNDVEFAII